MDGVQTCKKRRPGAFNGGAVRRVFKFFSPREVSSPRRLQHHAEGWASVVAVPGRCYDAREAVAHCISGSETISPVALGSRMLIPVADTRIDDEHLRSNRNTRLVMRGHNAALKRVSNSAGRDKSPTLGLVSTNPSSSEAMNPVMPPSALPGRSRRVLRLRRSTRQHLDHYQADRRDQSGGSDPGDCRLYLDCGP